MLQTLSFPSFALILPAFEEGNWAERFFRDFWFAYGDSWQEKESFLEIGSQHRQAQDLRDTRLADIRGFRQMVQVSSSSRSK